MVIQHDLFFGKAVLNVRVELSSQLTMAGRCEAALVLTVCNELNESSSFWVTEEYDVRSYRGPTKFSVPGQATISDVIMSAVASQITSVSMFCSTICSDADQRKTSKLRVTGLCEGNSRVTGEFPAQRPVTRSFDAFFDLRLNKRLSKQS